MKINFRGVTVEVPQLEKIAEGLTRIEKMGEQIMATLDELLANVTAQTTRIDSLNTLMDGIRQQLADALSGMVIAPEVQRKIDAVFAAAQTNAAKIEEAIAENTPGSTPGDEV
jgi:predicted butyrate kinase (DUF1464 family)